jgi:hypothetical protein
MKILLAELLCFAFLLGILLVLAQEILMGSGKKKDGQK